jgi:phosphoribosylformimino-5-aminoimidazole carboxamide ribotide isomerase
MSDPLNTSPTFTVFPAIDLRHGKVVRLAQGDPTRQTIYGDDPRIWAERWKSEGAEWLHVVNLDGAFGEDARSNLEALATILTMDLKVEFGGGLRDRVTILRVMDLGIDRLFLGTAAVQEPALLDWAIATFSPARIAGDIGTCDGYVTIKGWQERTPITFLEISRRFRQQGLEWCVLTDVSRDGTSTGVNLETAIEIQRDTGMKVVASGGVDSVEEVHSARAAGLAGIIIGRALYEGRVSLQDCWMEL